MPNTTGAILRQARREAKLTQRQLAKKIQLDPSQVSRYENDVWAPTVDLLRRWAKACNTVARKLVGS